MLFKRSIGFKGCKATCLAVVLGALLLQSGMVQGVQAAPVPSPANQAPRPAGALREPTKKSVPTIDQLLAVDPHAHTLHIDDQILPAAALRRYRASRRAASNPNGPQASSIASWATKWPGGRVAYVYDASMTAAKKTVFEEACREWEKHADLLFTPRVAQTNYLLVAQTVNTSNSHIGMTGGAQILNLANWAGKDTAVHEIAHALGIIHEQSRPGRDAYVTINAANIEPGMEGNFSIVDGALNQGAYDFDSIMHYWSGAFSVNGQPTIVANPGYTQYQNTMGQGTETSDHDASGMAAIYGTPPIPNIPVASIAAGAVTEAAGGATGLLTVTLSYPAPNAATVSWETRDDTALAGSDYVTATGTLNFAAGEQSKTVSVAINDDQLIEGMEKMSVYLTGATSATVHSINRSGVLSINDNDTLTLSQPPAGSTYSSVGNYLLRASTSLSAVTSMQFLLRPMVVGTAPSAAIPADGTTLSSTISISATDVMRGVYLRYAMTHPAPSEVVFTLRAPNGTQFGLPSHPNPWFNLSSSFAGQALNGDWLLTVRDTVVNANNGTLDNWKVILAPPSGATTLLATDSDGMVNGWESGWNTANTPNGHYSALVRAYNGTTLLGETINDYVTVAKPNTAPTGSVSLSPAVVRTNDTLSVNTGGIFDSNGDVLTFSYVWRNGGVVIAGQTTSSLNLALAGNGDKGQLISVEVTANDGQGAAPVFTASKTVQNDVPSGLTLSNTVFAEETAVGTPIGTFSTTDADAGETFTYDFVAEGGVNANVLFSIDGNVLKTDGYFNFETQSSYLIRVKTTDAAGASFIQEFTLTVSDVIEDTPSLVVNTLSDVASHDGLTSLREAIHFANRHFNSSAITFDPTFFNVAKTIVLEGSLPMFIYDVSITGPAAGVTIDGGNQSFSIFLLDEEEVDAEFSGLTIRNGSSGIYNGHGAITVSNSTFTNNLYGVYSSGVVSNTNISNSTFSGNGTGFFRNGGVATLSNSTFSDNATGLYCNLGTTTLKNTLVAGNTTADISGSSFASGGNNLIGNVGDSGFANGVNGDKVGGGTNPILDAKLGPLALNGGPTATFALLFGSPAINAGLNSNAAGLTTDQRGAGYSRVVGTTVDIGAFEWSDSSAPLISFATPTHKQRLNMEAFTSITGSATDASGVTQVVVKLFRTRGGVNHYWNGTSFGSAQPQFPAVLASPGANSTTWEFAVTPALRAQLDSGEYIVYAYGRDAANNNGSAVARLFTLADSTPPVVSVATPTQKQLLGTAAFTSITGSATDASGVTQVVVKLFRTRGGINHYWSGTSFGSAQLQLPAVVASPGATNTTWSFAVTPALRALLDEGEYVAYAYGRDGANNGSSAVARLFTLDGIAPVVSIATPTVSQRFSPTSFVSVSGSASDSGGVAQVLITLSRTRNSVTTFWNGTSFGASPVQIPVFLSAAGANNTNWSYSIPNALRSQLDNGAYSLDAFARDRAGNLSQANNRAFLIDSLAPLVTVATPTHKQLLTQPAFTSITGSATDDAGVSQVVVKLYRTRGGVTSYWNGTSFGSTQVQLPAVLANPGATSTTWEFPVTTALRGQLDGGEYVAYAYGRDALNNGSSAVARLFTLSPQNAPRPPANSISGGNS